MMSRMRGMNRIQVLGVVTLGLVGVGGRWAHAGTICQAVEQGVVEVDGSLDEWQQGFPPPLARGHGGADASFQMRCAYDQVHLYLAVTVRDDRVVRTGHPGPAGQDALELSLSADGGRPPWRLRLLPGTRGFKARRVGGGGAVRFEDSLTPDGWRVEASLPLQRIPGWGPHTPLLRGKVVYRDADGRGDPGGRLLFRGSMHFSGAVPALRGLLSAMHMTVWDFRLDALANVDTGAGNERVVAGGAYIGVLSDEFAYLSLPVTSAADVHKVELVDFDGDGRSSIVAWYRQRGGGGSRDVVTVWNLAASGQFEVALSFEVGVELGGRRLVNHWSLVPAGSRRSLPGAGRRRASRHRRSGGPGQDILVEVGEDDNTGWNPRSFAQLQPSPDARPPLVPWAPKKAVVYYFAGTTALEAAATAR